eukprot:g3596.t1
MDSHLLDAVSPAVGVRLAARAAKRALVSSKPHAKRKKYLDFYGNQIELKGNDNPRQVMQLLKAKLSSPTTPWNAISGRENVSLSERRLQQLHAEYRSSRASQKVVRATLDAEMQVQRASVWAKLSNEQRAVRHEACIDECVSRIVPAMMKLGEGERLSGADAPRAVVQSVQADNPGWPGVNQSTLKRRARAVMSGKSIAPPGRGGRKPILSEQAEEAIVDIALQSDRVGKQMAPSELRVEAAVHLAGTVEGSKFKVKDMPSLGHAKKMLKRAVQRKQAGTAVPVADTRERSNAVHYLNFEEYYNDVAEMLLNAKPPIAIKNPDFDPDKPFSEPIIITQPHRVIVGDETSWSQRVEEKGGRASLKIVPYSKSVQAKKEGGARAGAAQSAHAVGTNNGWSDTLMVACNLAGETLSMMWIQQKGTVEAEDEAAALAASFTDSTGAPMTASGKAIGLVLRANSKGGMTHATFRAFIDECVVPHCPGLSQSYEYCFLLGGCYDHAGECNLQHTASLGMKMKFPCPETTSESQAHDDKEGQFHTLKAFAWPSAMVQRQRWLDRHGMTRPLDRSDMVPLLEICAQQAFSMTVNNKALANVGLRPFSRKPMFREHVVATKGTEREGSRMLDVGAIKYHVDTGKLEEASKELLKQLAGKKFGSGNYWRHLANGPEGLALAKAYRNLQRMKLESKMEAAERRAMQKADAEAKAHVIALKRAAKEEEKAAKKAAKEKERADREQKKKEESRKKPLIQRAQQAARKAKNLNNLTPAMIRTLEGLLSRMEG